MGGNDEQDAVSAIPCSEFLEDEARLYRFPEPDVVTDKRPLPELLHHPVYSVKLIRFQSNERVRDAQELSLFVSEFELRRLRPEVEPLRRDRIVIRMKVVDSLVGQFLDSGLLWLNLYIVETDSLDAFPVDIRSQIFDLADCLCFDDFSRRSVEKDSLPGRE